MTTSHLAAPSAAAPRAPWARVRLDHLWLVVPLAFVFSYATALPLSHVDFYYHLVSGRLMVEYGDWLGQQPLVYAPEQEPRLNQPWLAQLAYYALYRAGGPELVLLWHAGTVTAAFVGIRQLALQRSGSSRLAALAVLGSLALSATNLAVRPQSMSLALFAWLLWLLERQPASPRLPWLAAGLSGIWANLHGSFPLAPLVIGAYLVGGLVDGRGRPTVQVCRFGLTLAVSAVATLANPLGPAAYSYALSVATHPIIRSAIVEWRPPSLDSLTGALFFASLPAAALAAWTGRRSLRPAHLVLLGGLLALALSAQRNVVWWGLAMPALLADCSSGLPRGADRSARFARTTAQAAQASGRFPTMRREHAGLNAALLAVAVLIAALSLPWLKAGNPLLASHLRTVLDPARPEGVADFLEARRLEGRLLARMEWGGYLAWRLWPKLTPFLDARLERRSAEVWQDYFAIMGARPGWQALVERYGADYLVVDPRYSPRLLEELEALPEWQELYRDQQAVLFARARA